MHWTYLIVSSSSPACDFGVGDAARLEAVGAEGAECYGGGAVEAAYCPPVDGHCDVYGLRSEVEKGRMSCV